MWGSKKLAQIKKAQMHDDFVKEQIQKKLKNYSSTQGPARFYGMAAAQGVIVEFENVSLEWLRSQNLF